jgi:ABC-type transport system substrate-binding protein
MNTDDEFMRTQPLTRRHVLKMSALSAISLLAASPPKATAAAAPAIKRGGSVVHADVFNFPSMDPTTGAMSANHLSYTGLFDSLVRLELADPKTGEQKVTPELAESWEFTNPTTLVFKLRKGVTFHDGSPFNAAAAAWNFIRMRDHKLARKAVYFTDKIGRAHV